MPSLSELVESRLKLVADMRALDEANPNGLNAEQQSQFDKIFDEQENLSKTIENRYKLENLEKKLSDPTSKPVPTNAGGAPENRGEDEKEKELRMKAFRSYIQYGSAGLQREEFRALNAGLVTEGGAFIPPQEFSTSLIKAVDDLVHIRRLASTFTVVKAGSLGFPTWEADPSDADWTTELATGNLDSSMATGLREFKPQPVAKRVKLSRTLLRKSLLPVENLVRERLAYKFAVTHEKAFMTGNGANQPLGLFTASDKGIPTSRDISTDMEETDVTGDALIECFFNLKEQYQGVATWLMHRLFKKKIRKLKDGEGRYLWEASIRAGDPDTLLTRPIVQSEYAPSTFTTGQYAAICGDFSKYYIVDDIGTLEIQKLVELYAESNQDGFIGRMESDGMPILAEAWSRLKFA